jgi:hypothetical protein
MRKVKWAMLLTFGLVMTMVSLNSAALEVSQKEQEVLIEGMVVDGENNPVGGVSVRASRGAERLATYKTKSNGSYILRFPPGGSVTSVVYTALDYCPCSILNVSGKARHNITKVLYKKNPNGPCPNYAEVKATLSYFDAHPQSFSEERAMYADLRNEMGPRSAPPYAQKHLSSDKPFGFVVPEGTVLVAQLNNDVRINPPRKNQPFTMTVMAPFEFEGASITGTISSVKKRNDQARTRYTIAVDFQTIKLIDRVVYGFNASLIDIEVVDELGRRVRRQFGSSNIYPRPDKVAETILQTHASRIVLLTSDAENGTTNLSAGSRLTIHSVTSKN